ncbi:MULTISPECIES: CHRD domain-containing protein [unclassified Bradyrhizobium]|uniref:CHRD domain-containing protein n=1 Tax=unclassified Bradyrhizobium TaxID=2631580 RepID=UPI001FF88B67|nr:MULTISPECIES: CHRD domain-containing protein [unclassified Bradyrhizobium]
MQPIEGVRAEPRFSRKLSRIRQRFASGIAGKWYANIHIAANPGGELRGQVGPAGFRQGVWVRRPRSPGRGAHRRCRLPLSAARPGSRDRDRM